MSTYDINKKCKYPLPDKDVFESYFRSHTNKECAKHFGVSSIVIDRWRCLHGFTKIKKYPSSLTSVQKQLITGSMLGDGSIHKVRKTYNVAFEERHAEQQLDYLKWKAEILSPFVRDIIMEISDGKSLEKLNGLKPKQYKSYKLDTIKSQIFSDIEKDWYLRDGHGNYVYNDFGRRIKKIPDDLQVNEFILAVWYLDDGRNTTTRKCAYLSTDCFTHQEVCRLCDMIASLGIKATPVKTRRGQHEIYISCCSYEKFLGIISDNFPPNCSCLEYKIKNSYKKRNWRNGGNRCK